MNKQGCYFILMVAFSAALAGCLGGIWTGANLVYTRHHLYEKVDDFTLGTSAHQLLYADKQLKQKGCYLDLAVFNNDVLLAGHVPDNTLRKLAKHRLEALSGYRKMYTQVSIGNETVNGVEDTWITTKIRSKIIADYMINPDIFKIITVDGIVYIMGDVPGEQATRVLNIARNTDRVIRVVKLIRYYTLSKTPDSYS